MVASIRPSSIESILGKQLVRSATSIGANFREACRARSTAEFISKIAVAEAEAAETSYWLELIGFSTTDLQHVCLKLKREADEMTAILTRTGRSKKEKAKDERRQ